eukprot:393599-Alexandrium_andersonii.AAC.1
MPVMKPTTTAFSMIMHAGAICVQLDRASGCFPRLPGGMDRVVRHPTFKVTCRRCRKLSRLAILT